MKKEKILSLILLPMILANPVFANENSDSAVESSETANPQKKKGMFDDWPGIIKFHDVMSDTFHSSQEGNFEPIKNRSQEMLERAQDLMNQPLPEEFNTNNIKRSIDRLVFKSDELDKLIKSEATEAKITDSLNELHDVFHDIIGQCREEFHQ